MLRKCKFVLVALFFTVVPLSLSFAVPAFPGALKFHQPDGEIVKGFLKGDEYFSWREAESGELIIRNPSTGYYDYAVVRMVGEEESLVPSGIPFSARSGETKSYIFSQSEPVDGIDKATREDAIRIWKSRRSSRFNKFRRGGAFGK